MGELLTVVRFAVTLPARVLARQNVLARLILVCRRVLPRKPDTHMPMPTRLVLQPVSTETRRHCKRRMSQPGRIYTPGLALRSCPLGGRNLSGAEVNDNHSRWDEAMTQSEPARRNRSGKPDFLRLITERAAHGAALGSHKTEQIPAIEHRHGEEIDETISRRKAMP